VGKEVARIGGKRKRGKRVSGNQVGTKNSFRTDVALEQLGAFPWSRSIPTGGRSYLPIFPLSSNG